MTSELNLNDSQQTKVKQLFLEMGQSNPKINKKRSEMTSDEKFEFKNSILDQQIEIKKGLKEILSENQFKKWEKSHYRKTSHSRTKSVRGKKGSR